ncbi:MAG TPA: NADH-quinone oxidoreductase subunit C [Syntrophales bacterium]|nr:NADH-quinone oxidoreductase subunit C [Syntrophales bacterium]
MEPREIADLIKERYPADVREVKEFRGQFSVSVRKEIIKELMRYLHDTPELYFNFLEDLCGVDYLGKKEPRFEVVYHLFSLRHRHMIRIKAAVPEEDASIDSVVDVWAGANWHERECFDLFGITFKGHPDLRRILLPEDWEGHPLRKDYPLQAEQGEKEWHGYKEIIDVAEKNKKYEVR